LTQGSRTPEEVFRNLTKGTPLYLRHTAHLATRGRQNRQSVGRFAGLRNGKVYLDNDASPIVRRLSEISVVVQLSDNDPVGHLKDLGVFGFDFYPVTVRHFSGTYSGRVVATHRKQVTVRFHGANGQEYNREKPVTDLLLPGLVTSG
jgi:hypothetical protein